MQTLKLVSLVSVSALALAASSSAFAQTATPTSSAFNPQQILGYNAQSGTLNANAIASGVTSTSLASQLNTNNLNQLGGTPLVGGTVNPLFSGDSAVSIGQVVGGIGGVGVTPAWTTGGKGTAADSFTQGTSNSITSSSTNTQGFLSAVTAGGNQNSTNGVNTAGLGVINGANVSLQQALNQSVVSSQSSTNSLTAASVTGAATVNGFGGTQNAQSALNAASIGIGSTTNAAGATVNGAISVGLDQKQLGLAITETSTNNAGSSVGNGPNPVIDPTTQNLNQNAGISQNTFSAIGGALQLSNGTSQIGQDSGTKFNPGSISNVATAATGNSTGVYGTAGAQGSSTISAVNQAANVALNTASNTGGNLNFGNSISPFTQNVSSNYAGAAAATANIVSTTSASPSTQVPTNAPGPLTNVVNNQSTLTAYGNATVTGTTGSPTQSSNQTLNSASSTGMVSGSLAQTAGSTLQGATVPATAAGIVTNALTNVAAATTNFGGSTVSGVSQGQNNTVNTLSGAAGVGLNLQQAAAGITGLTPNTVGGTNLQLASTGGGVASITGASQALNAGANTANLGGVLNGTVSQLGTSISTNNANTLKSNGGAAVVIGTQSAVGSANVIK